MTTKEALEIVDQVAAKFVADGQTHRVIANAIEVLRTSIEPPAIKPTPPAK